MEANSECENVGHGIAHTMMNRINYKIMECDFDKCVGLVNAANKGKSSFLNCEVYIVRNVALTIANFCTL